jgi:endonuclease/exonuclease/phosphatase family metal-dependent hydrolase
VTLPRDERTIRLMTWNIHRGVGPDGRFELERIAALIARHAPDIVALQEVDTRGRDPSCLAPLKALHAENGHVAEARTITAPDGHYGHAVFSRWPIRNVKLHDLSMGRREPRSAIETVVETEQGDLHLVAVHLGLAVSERRRQAKMLTSLAMEQEGLGTVMLGDFNDWFSFGKVRSTLAAVLPERTMLATFPARWPRLRLDRVYCRLPCRLVRCWTDKDARQCSDHLPVIAEIRILKPDEAISAARPGGSSRT